MHRLIRTGTILRSCLPWAAILLPVFLLARLIAQHAVNIPFLDDWMFVHMDTKLAAGTLTLHDFFMVQMEHRMAFVRAVIMLFHQLWPDDYTTQMWFTWVLLCGTLVNMAVLLRRTAGASFRYWWPVLLLVSITIFSPVQYRIVLWAMMFQVASPCFFLSLAMVVLLGGRPLWFRFVVMLVCAWCATLSFATGILIWLLLIPLMWWSGAIKNARSRKWFLACWLVAFAVTMGLYFHNLKNEVDPQFSYKQGDEETMGRNFREFFNDPGRALAFVVRFLGCHLGRGSTISVMDSSLWLGGLSLLLLVGACVYWVLRFRDPDLRARLLPWILLGGYSVGAATLTALGRVWASQNGDNAIHARYVIHAIPLTVGLVVLVWLIARDFRQRHPAWNRLVLEFLTGAGLALVVIQGISWAFGWRMMEVWESSRLRGAANTMFFKVLAPEGNIAGLSALARQADSLEMLDPPMLNSRRLDNFSLVPKLLSPNSAKLSTLTLQQSEDGIAGRVSGFACLPDRSRVADAVLLTYKDPDDGHWEIFHVTQVRGLPLYIAEILSRDLQFVHTPGEGGLNQEGLAGFTGTFQMSELPRGERSIMAWALDYKRMRVHPMSGYFKIDTVAQKVKKLGTDPKSVNLDWFIEKGKGNKNWEQLK